MMLPSRPESQSTNSASASASASTSTSRTSPEEMEYKEGSSQPSGGGESGESGGKVSSDSVASGRERKEGREGASNRKEWKGGRAQDSPSHGFKEGKEDKKKRLVTSAAAAVAAASSSSRGRGLIMYDAETLRKLAESALSLQWPAVLDEQFKNDRGKWDPDQWHQATRPAPDENNQDKARRNAKDRLKAEQNNDLVLSPQRRSFLSGCQGSGRADGEEETASPGPPSSEQPLILAPNNRNRRVGSGRIVNRGGGEEAYEGTGGGAGASKTRFKDLDQFVSSYDSRRREGDWDRRPNASERTRPGRGAELPWDRDNRAHNDHPRDRFLPPRSSEEHHHLPHRNGPAGRLSSRFDREPGRNDRGGMMDHSGGGGYNRRRNIQPEWMDEEIDQQGELMELGGFEDAEKRSRENRESSRRKHQEERQHSEATKEEKASIDQGQQGDFNLDDFLKTESLDTILAPSKNGNGILSQGGNVALDEAEASGSGQRGSRFTQFFKTNTDQRNTGDAPGSGQLDIDPSVTNTGSGPEKVDKEFYFAPISPAATTTISSPKRREPKVDDRPLEDLQRQLESTFVKKKGEGGGREVQTPLNMSELFGGSLNNTHQAEMGPFEKFAALVAPKDSNASSDIGHKDLKGLPMDPHRRPPLPPSHYAHAPPLNHHRSPLLHPSGAPLMPVPVAIPELPDLLELIWNHEDQPQLQDLPEAQVIKSALANGHIDPISILNQFANGSASLQPVQKDILVTFIKRFQREGKLPLKMTPEIRDIVHREHNKVAAGIVIGPQPVPHCVPMASNTEDDGLDPAIITRFGQRPPIPPMQGMPPWGEEQTDHPTGPRPQTVFQKSKDSPVDSPRNQSPHPSQAKTPHAGALSEQQKQCASPKAGGSSSLSGGFTPTVVIKKLVADRRDSEPRVNNTDLPQELRNAGVVKCLLPSAAPVDTGFTSLESLIGQVGPMAGAMPPMNDLSKFFAPDLLAQANSGNAPVMPPLPKQKAMTLEELEHQEESLKV